VFLVSSQVAQPAQDAAAQIHRQVKRRLGLALLVLVQNVANQRRFRLPKAFGLILKPDQQRVGQFHRQSFHADKVTLVWQDYNTELREEIPPVKTAGLAVKA
jgi:hypothetical protein